MNGKFIIVDMQKNTTVVDADTMSKMFSALYPEVLHDLLRDHTYRHKTLSDMDRDIHGWIKGFEKEGDD